MIGGSAMARLPLKVRADQALSQPPYYQEALSLSTKLEATAAGFTDSRNGKTYRVVKIGSQTWMAENLNYATGNSWCYDNESSNCAKWGRLYDWRTARSACPSGWHLPSDEDWKGLDALPAKGIRTQSWSGTNATGFNALSAGSHSSDGSFGNAGSYAFFWSSTENGAQFAWSRYLHADYETLNRSSNLKTTGFSVRCLKD
jgi:uncharacterized protein (TIGR02145 family)